MIIHLATDHAGFEHKEAVKAWLQAEGYEVVDHGARSFESTDDFPDFISLAAKAVNEDSAKTKGIVFGGSGQGEGMMANSYPYVRATVYYGGDTTIPRLSREHNDANVLALGARFITIDEAKQVIWEWLHTPASADPKYHRRNQKMADITKHINS
jgi:ribose 5-phosphate isomerase B